MKKVSIYSLLFALLALNPLHVKADSTKSLRNLLHVPVSALGLGILSMCSFYLAKQYKDDDELYQSFAPHSYFNEDLYLAEAKNFRIYAGISLFAGVGSLLGAGYLAYKTLQQARS